MKDIIIIGSGPGGMTAAIYALRAGMNVTVVEASMYGGQMATTPDVQNFPAFQKISGFDLAQNMYDQMMALGAEFLFQSVISVEKEDNIFKVVTDENTHHTKAIIFANGAKRRRLHCPGEEEFIGRGVSYCATCDGAFFQNQVTAVIGGGNTALEDALYLSNLCKKIYLVHRRDTFRGEAHLVNQVKNTPHIEIMYNQVPVSVQGEKRVYSITEIPVNGVFVAVGLEPDNSRFSNIVKLDPYGYIIAGENCETSTSGVYAVGDTRTKTLRQIVTAAADGAVAGAAAAHYIQK